MDFGIIVKVLGLLLLTEAAAMLPSLAIAFYFGEGDTTAFVWSILLTGMVGLILSTAKSKKKVVRYREGFMIVGLGWILASFFGAFPFLFAGTFETFTDAFFETVSGFTTTGATVLRDIEIQTKGILFWRSFTHWLGGMGILVFTLALLPAMGLGTMQIFRAESPGPAPDKLVPKVGQTAKLLYGVYILVTLSEIILLKFAGMGLFDAITHTFATVGTGGFSTQNASVGAYNSPIFEYIIIFFMFVAGVNFALYYDAVHGNFQTLLKDREFRFYGMVVFTAIVLVTININHYVFNHIGQSIRYASFQVVSIVTTTGFGTIDYEVWPDYSKMLLFALMFIGGSSGSTGGAIKHIRILLVLKVIRRELYKLIHPKAVIAIRVGNKTVPEEVLQNVMSFIFLYLLIFLSGSILLLTQGMDLLSSTSAVAATLGNIGPGFGMVGPTMNYADLTTFTKWVLSIFMILGRLEIYTILVLVMPAFWDN